MLAKAAGGLGKGLAVVGLVMGALDINQAINAQTKAERYAAATSGFLNTVSAISFMFGGPWGIGIGMVLTALNFIAPKMAGIFGAMEDIKDAELRARKLGYDQDNAAAMLAAEQYAKRKQLYDIATKNFKLDEEVLSEEEKSLNATEKKDIIEQRSKLLKERWDNLTIEEKAIYKESANSNLQKAQYILAKLQLMEDKTLLDIQQELILKNGKLTDDEKINLAGNLENYNLYETSLEKNILLNDKEKQILKEQFKVGDERYKLLVAQEIENGKYDAIGKSFKKIFELFKAGDFTRLANILSIGFKLIKLKIVEIMNAMGTWNTKSLKMAQSLLGKDFISDEEIDKTGVYTSDKNFEDIIRQKEKKILSDLDIAMNPEKYMTEPEKKAAKEAQVAEELRLKKESLNAQKQNTVAVNGLNETIKNKGTTQTEKEINTIIAESIEKAFILY